jgi:hypothetical protein
MVSLEWEREIGVNDGDFKIGYGCQACIRRRYGIPRRPLREVSLGVAMFAPDTTSSIEVVGGAHSALDREGSFPPGMNYAHGNGKCFADFEVFIEGHWRACWTQAVRPFS